MRSLRRAAAGAALLLAASSNALAQQPAPGGEPPAPGAEPAAQPPGQPPVAPEGEAEAPRAPVETATPAATPAATAQVTAAAAKPGAEVGAAAAPAGAAAESMAPGWRERIRVPVGPIGLAPILLLQAQASPYVGEGSFHQAGDIAERPGFRLRRARLGIAGDVQEKVRFAVSAQLGSEDDGALRVHDAWAGYTAMPYLQVFAGARDVAFSRSAITGAGDGALIERPLAVRAIAPFKQVGIQAEGHFADEAFSYSAGAYNGFQRSDQFYEGHAESYAPLGNRFEGIAVAGRVASEPLGRLGRTIQDVEHSPFRIGVGGNYFFSNGGARTLQGAGGDVLLHVAGLHVLAEMLWLRASPRDQPSQLTHREELFGLSLANDALTLQLQLSL
jgi:hypothetical protein